MGGREIHPISAAVGGFHKVPSKTGLRSLVEDLKWALDASLATARLVARFEFPDFEQDYEFVALSAKVVSGPLSSGHIGRMSEARPPAATTGARQR